MKDIEGTELKIGDKVAVSGSYLRRGVIVRFTPKNACVEHKVLIWDYQARDYRWRDYTKEVMKASNKLLKIGEPDNVPVVPAAPVVPVIPAIPQ